MTELKSKEYIRHLARQCMFDCSDEELEVIQEEFVILDKQMELLNEVNTEGIEPMVYPFETPTTFLRKDIVENVLSEEDALKNAAKTKNGHVVVPKVVR